MPTTSPSLVIGNYNTSSWSLRAWLVLRQAGIAFEEVRVPLHQGDTRKHLRELSPSGRVPVLTIDGVTVWDSLSIAELLAERHPDLWPTEPPARAVARSVAAEMHSGFIDLRALMPLDVVGRFGPPGRLLHAVDRDVRRIKAIWRTCREEYGGGGDFLFGAFTIADAFMAPVASRFVTYAIDLEPEIDAYVAAVMAWPAMVAWQEAAAREVAALAKLGELDVERTRRGPDLEQTRRGKDRPAPPPTRPVPQPAAQTRWPSARPEPRPQEASPQEVPPPDVRPTPAPPPADRPPVEPRPERAARVMPAPEPPPRSAPPPPMPRAAEPPQARRAPPERQAPLEPPPSRQAPAPEPPARSQPGREPRPPREGYRPPPDDLPDNLRRWRPAGSGVRSTNNETRRRR